MQWSQGCINSFHDDCRHDGDGHCTKANTQKNHQGKGESSFQNLNRLMCRVHRLQRPYWLTIFDQPQGHIACRQLAHNELEFDLAQNYPSILYPV